MTRHQADRARTLLELGRYDEAQRLIVSLLAVDPDDAELHRLQGWALLGSDHGIESARCADRALALEPDSAEGHLLRALGLCADGWGEQAMAAARRAVALDPHEARHHAALATALSLAGHHAEAWDAASRAVELDPEDPFMHLTMGEVAAAYPAPDVATSAYRRALSLDPTNAAARHNLATQDSQHSLRRGMDGFMAALALDPQLPEAATALDAVTLQMLIWARWAAQMIFVVSLVGYVVLGVDWLGLPLGALFLVVGLVGIARLPTSFRRSRRRALRGGLICPAVTIVTVGVTALALAGAALVALLPPRDAGTEGGRAFVLVAWGLVYGVEAWTRKTLERYP